MSIKEQLIRDLIRDYDFTDKNWSLSAIESKLHKFLGEIPAINVVYKNEQSWDSIDLGNRVNLNRNKIPIEIGQSPIPNEVLTYNNGTLNIPENSLDRAIVKWNWEESQMKEVKLKDKWIKIRVRYKGDKLAIITAVKTLYSISY